MPRARGQREAEGADAGQALLAALADRRGDPPRVVERRRRGELDVEGDERRAGGDEHRAAAG